MSDTYRFTTTNNAEIGLRWYELALSSPAAPDFASVAANWIVSPLKGRMKFCRPIFKLVNKVDNKLAQETFKANKTSFHPIARKLIEKVRSIWFPIEPKVPNYIIMQDLGLV
jgi:leukotriene-A4 hydrolase